MRRRMTLGGALLATALLAGPANAAGGDPVKATPDPFETPDLPGCYGNLNATFNHGSGVQEHGRDSKGPGWYFRDGQLFQEIKSETREVFCGDS